MPIVYRCSHCGFILHVYVRVGQNSYGVPTPTEIHAMYGGVCPRCGKPLNTKPTIDDITVLPHGRRVLVQVLKSDEAALQSLKYTNFSLYTELKREVAADG